MEKNNAKKLDDFLTKTVKLMELDSPSSNFTDTVLAKINVVEEKNITTTYQALISKKVWWVLAVFVFGLSAYLLFGNFPIEDSWLHFSKLNQLMEFNLFGELDFISDTTVYGLIALTFFVYIQVYLLKRYFTRRYFIE